MLACKSCGVDLEPGVFYMCDVVDGEFCSVCFKKIGCRILHDEGCATVVYGDGERT